MQSSDYIAALATFIALLALLATFWQGWLARKHNRLSVTPLLVWSIERGKSPLGAHASLVVSNKGVGPAIITVRFFTVHGQRFHSQNAASDEVMEILRAAFGDAQAYEVQQWGLPGEETALAANESVSIFKLLFPATSHDELTAILDRCTEHIDLCVEYRCLYGHPRTLRTGDESRVQLRRERLTS